MAKKTMGFDVNHSLTSLSDTIREHYIQARIDLLNEFQSAGYKHIIDSILIEPDFSKIQINFKAGYEVSKQDVFELFAQGGTLMKTNENGEKETVAVKPSAVVKKYLGKR